MCFASVVCKNVTKNVAHQNFYMLKILALHGVKVLTLHMKGHLLPYDSRYTEDVLTLSVIEILT